MHNDHVVEAMRAHEESKDTDRRFAVTASDSTELMEGMTVYRNYVAEPIVKGKIINVSLGRQGNGFILVEWADGERTVELSSWLRTDPEMVYSHPMWETVASKGREIIAVLNEEKEVFKNDFGVRICRCAQGYNVYIRDHTAKCRNDDMLKEVLGSLPFELMPEDEDVVISQAKGEVQSTLEVFAEEKKENAELVELFEDYKAAATSFEPNSAQRIYDRMSGLFFAKSDWELNELHDDLMGYMVSRDKEGVLRVLDRMSGQIPIYRTAAVEEDSTIKVYSPVKAKLKRYVNQDLEVDGIVVAIVEKKEEEEKKKAVLVSLPMYGYKVYEFFPEELEVNKRGDVKEEDKKSADKAYEEYRKIVKTSAEDKLKKVMLDMLASANALDREIKAEVMQCNTTEDLLNWATSNGWSDHQVKAAKRLAGIV